MYDLRCCRMSQSEMRSATSANAAPVSTAGPWMLPYNSRKLEEDPPSDAIASSHIQPKALCTLQQRLLLPAGCSTDSRGEGKGLKGGPEWHSRKKLLEKIKQSAADQVLRRAANELNPRRAGRVGVPVLKIKKKSAQGDESTEARVSPYQWQREKRNQSELARRSPVHPHCSSRDGGGHDGGEKEGEKDAWPGMDAWSTPRAG